MMKSRLPFAVALPIGIAFAVGALFLQADHADAMEAIEGSSAPPDLHVSVMQLESRTVVATQAVKLQDDKAPQREVEKVEQEAEHAAEIENEQEQEHAAEVEQHDANEQHDGGQHQADDHHGTEDTHQSNDQHHDQPENRGGDSHHDGGHH